MSVYDELMNERLKPEQVYKPPKQTPQQRAENLKAIQKYIADAKAKKAAAAEAEAEAKPETDVSHTEYEGPSLREKLAHLAELTVAQQHAAYEKQKSEIVASRKAGKKHRLDPGEEIELKAHTEHEGPSLREKLEKLRRGHSEPRRGTKKHPTIQGGWLSRAAETPGAGRVLVGSWAQERHRKAGSKGDAPITYADK